MSITLSGTVSVASSGENAVYTITITASTSNGTTLGTTEIQASAASPVSYKITNLPPGQTFVKFQSDKLIEVSEIILLGLNAANVIDVEMRPNAESGYQLKTSTSGRLPDDAV
jgi:hypothetical protein